jgi:hypothetical protein
MGKHSARDAARWELVESYLELKTWTDEMAAYLLLGLDPEARYWECWDMYWLPGIPVDASVRIEDQSDQSASESLRDLLRRTKQEKASTPREWIAWSCRARCEPPWLKEAYGNKKLQPLLPRLPARKDAPPSPRPLHSEISALGGRGRHAKTPAGRAKPIVRRRYEEWLKQPPDKRETKTAFAHRVCEELRKRAERDKDAPYVQESTVLRWMTKWQCEQPENGAA